MLLSSITKLAKYTRLPVDGDGDDALRNRQQLLSWQNAISAKIEDFCRRSFIIESRTEYFDTGFAQRAYFPRGIPIVSITSVKADALGRFDGTSEYTLSSSDYHLGVDSLWVDINYAVSSARRGLQIIYTGGLAYHAIRSVFTVGSVSGTPAAGQWVTNATKTAVGIVRVWSTPSLTVENVYGTFVVDDVLSFATSEKSLYGNSTTLSGIAATITAVSQQSLSEAFPDLERACEVEVRYMQKHQYDFENVSTMNDQTQRRQSTQFQRPFDLQPESKALLSGYRRPYM